MRIGVDLTRVADVAASLACFGDRYLRRIYTEHEIASCTGAPEVVASRLAARFAAKEAVVKVLRPTGARPEWRDIEVRRAPEGACSLRLTGNAAKLASAEGITSLAVCLTHEGDMAAAVVVAVLNPRNEEHAA